MEALVDAAGRRTQDGERRARPRARRARAAGRSPRAARRQPHRHRRSRTIRRSSNSSCAARCRRRGGRGLRHADPARPPHLPAKPLCDRVRRARRLRYFVRAGHTSRREGARAASAAAREGQRKKAPHATLAMTREQFERLVAEALARDPAPLPRRDAEHRDRRRGRAVAGAARARWRSSRPTRCSASTRARR